MCSYANMKQSFNYQPYSKSHILKGVMMMMTEQLKKKGIGTSKIMLSEADGIIFALSAGQFSVPLS